MSCSSTAQCTCGCCTGTSVQTPAPIQNAAGQPAITYRTGTWATFRESMLARLSSSDFPSLADLSTRDADDFTVALLDSIAVMLDILTFYQERLANESYLRTAVQLRSLTELVRLLGYQPAPGVASSTYLAFTLKSTPGLPANPSNPSITIPTGSNVQSVPAQGQTPQTFETSADILAKSDWNALPIQTALAWVPQAGDVSLYLAGTSTQLQPGDPILIVGDERSNPQTSEDWLAWDLRIVLSVLPDLGNARTLITWNEGLGAPSGSVTPSQSNPVVYALRQRSALFGYNAMNPNILTADVQRQLVTAGLLGGSGTFYWKNYYVQSHIDLETSYTKVVQGSWVAVTYPTGTEQPTRSLSGEVLLYRAQSVTQIPRTAYNLSSHITRITPDVQTGLYYVPLTSAQVFCQSEALAVAPMPLPYPLYGSVIDLDTLRPDLLNATVIALFGKAQKLAVTGSTAIAFQPADKPNDSAAGAEINPGDTLTIAGAGMLPVTPGATPDLQTLPDWTTQKQIQVINVLNPQGQPGTVTAPLTTFALTAAAKADPVISEYAQVLAILTVNNPTPHTRIVLTAPLVYCYDRTATTVNANVALATQGSSVTEIMGSGSSSTPNQRFSLKQKPLTFVSGSTAAGAVSTLSIRAAGVNWTEVPTLYGQPPTAQVYSTLNQPGGATTVVFGDSLEGATLPTGQSNLQASYRVGSGTSGNVAASTITTLLDRPLGVSGVTNPSAATGGQDAVALSELRSNAPQTVLTLGRVVSAIDYANFAADFSGISKAYALWIPAGVARGVFLTVAGTGGTAVPPSNPTYLKLSAAIAAASAPLTPVSIVSFIETLFGLSAGLKYDPAYDQPTVLAQVRQLLAATYSFSNRSFGQGVSSDEVEALIQSVRGVIAVHVNSLTKVASSTAGDILSQPGGLNVTNWNAWQAGSLPIPGSLPNGSVALGNTLSAQLPAPSLTALPQAAELLVLHPDPNFVQLGTMQ